MRMKLSNFEINILSVIAKHHHMPKDFLLQLTRGHDLSDDFNTVVYKMLEPRKDNDISEARAIADVFLSQYP